ncbi:MAG: hypothetical protein Q9180_007927, partial [Flavoplaca navasiana]
INIPSGILLGVDNENEMAAILSHEIAHIVADHPIERQSYRELGALMLLLFLPVIRVVLKVSDHFELVRDTIGTKTIASDGFNLFSQRREQEADYISMLVMSEAGYDPSAAVSILEEGIRENIIYRKADPESANEAIPVGRILVMKTDQDMTRIERV